MLIPITGQAYKETYDVKVGETFTVYTTYRSNTTSILWTIPYDYVDPVGYVGPVATSVEFRAKKEIPSGVIIQATTRVNYGSIDYVDDWLVRITGEPGPDPNPDPISLPPLSANPSGGQVEKGTVVKLYANGSGAQWYYDEVQYTLDGSDPKSIWAETYTYKGITINESCTLRAVGKMWNGSGYDYSSELNVTYTIKMNDGDIFTAKTAGGIDMTFKVVSAADMTCQVGGGTVLTYAVDDNTEGHVEIPETINGFKVVSIGSIAFIGRKGITSVSVPQTVKEFGSDSFNQCTNLESINFPQHLQVIGESAFYHDDKLSCPIVIPEGVSVLEKNTFEYCKSLTSVTLPSTLTDIREGVFRECRALESIKVPNGIKSIGEYAFDGCGFVSFDWPDKVTEIPEKCFSFCNNLVSIHIPQTVKKIGEEAFSYSGLQSLEDIPSSITEIGERAFFCADLTNVTIPSGITSISKETFRNCTKLSSVTISPSVETIGEGAFTWSQSLKEVYIPNSVKRIDEKAFFVCTNIKQIYSFIKEPFDINDNVFYSSEYENRLYNIYNKAILYVPNGTKSKYEATSGWKNFKNIVEFDPSGIEAVNVLGAESLPTYSLSGQRLAAPKKGINIIGRKKVVVK